MEAPFTELQKERIQLRIVESLADVGPLLAEEFDRTIEEMAATVSESLIGRIPGAPVRAGYPRPGPRNTGFMPGGGLSRDFRGHAIRNRLRQQASSQSPW